MNNTSFVFHLFQATSANSQRSSRRLQSSFIISHKLCDEVTIPTSSDTCSTSHPHQLSKPFKHSRYILLVYKHKINLLRNKITEKSGPIFRN